MNSPKHVEWLADLGLSALGVPLILLQLSRWHLACRADNVVTEPEFESVEYPFMDESPISKWVVRLPLIAAGATIVGLLITARCLTPSDVGIGTHQQLGLPPCGFVAMFGVPCPSCGMTTSWSHMTRGNIFSSFGANPGGALLAISGAVFGPWLTLCGFRGRWVPRPMNLWVPIVLLGVIFAVTLVNWILVLTS